MSLACGFMRTRVGVVLYNATFSNISVISWRYVHRFISTSETTKVQINYDMKGVTVEVQSGQSFITTLYVEADRLILLIFTENYCC